VLAKMPAGARLDVGDCKDGWSAVTCQGKSGFAIQIALDASGRPRTVRRAPPPGTDPDDDFEPVAPGYRPYPDAPPAMVYAPGPGAVLGAEVGTWMGLEEVVGIQQSAIALRSLFSRKKPRRNSSSGSRRLDEQAQIEINIVGWGLGNGRQENESACKLESFA
jgi:hypothetical protein